MFKIIFTNEHNQTTDLLFHLHHTHIAKKWYAELKKGYTIYDNDRFTNWYNQKDLINQLNICINKINEYDYQIPVNLKNNYTQDDLNFLHTFFEKLRGKVNINTNWYNNAPLPIQNYLNKFNIIIHQIETETKTKNHPTIVVTFANRPIILLDLDDIENFTFRWKQGTVYINYCHIGKPILDIFKDKDDLVEEAVPQTHYSADFMVKFGPSTPYPYYFFRKMLLERWIRQKNLDKQNLNIGLIPVAELATTFDFKKMQQFNLIKQIECLK